MDGGVCVCVCVWGGFTVTVQGDLYNDKDCDEVNGNDLGALS